ncbi:MAG: HlyD family efflux transporter periplasmic adaptor subunit [Candidatus Peregrinibacteria bacterium]
MDAPAAQSLAPEPAHSVKKLRRKYSRKEIIIGLIVLTVVATIGGIGYWLYESQFVYTDKAILSAPLIQLAAPAGGVLHRVTVEEGLKVAANKAVARVGDEMVLTHVAGTVVVVRRDVGTVFKPGEAVVTMIQPEELKVSARIEEDKGLKDIFVGQRVTFTVDAFGSKVFEGTVSSVSQTKTSGDVVFSISDKRQENEFEVKIDYDHEAYPELQNGMSARVWIVKGSQAS